MEVKVTFTYSNRAFQITCKEDDEMDKMFQLFIDKLNDGSEKSTIFIIMITINLDMNQQLKITNIFPIKMK